MRNQHSVWIGVGVLGAVVLLAAQLQRSFASTAAPQEAVAQASSGRPADASAADVAALRSELGRLRAQVNALPAAAPMAARIAVPPSETDVAKVDTKESIAESEQRWHEHMAEVAFGFEQEPRDGRWATSASAAVANGLKRDPTLAAMAGPIDCRSTTCRVQVERDAAGVVDKQLPIFLNGLTDALPVMDAEHEVIDGKPRYTLYLKTAAALAHGRDAAEER